MILEVSDTIGTIGINNVIKKIISQGQEELVKRLCKQFCFVFKSVRNQKEEREGQERKPTRLCNNLFLFVFLCFCVFCFVFVSARSPICMKRIEG